MRLYKPFSSGITVVTSKCSYWAVADGAQVHRGAGRRIAVAVSISS